MSRTDKFIKILILNGSKWVTVEIAGGVERANELLSTDEAWNWNWHHFPLVTTVQVEEQSRLVCMDSMPSVIIDIDIEELKMIHEIEYNI